MKKREDLSALFPSLWNTFRPSTRPAHAESHMSFFPSLPFFRMLGITVVVVETDSPRCWVEFSPKGGDHGLGWSRYSVVMGVCV